MPELSSPRERSSGLNHLSKLAPTLVLALGLTTSAARAAPATEDLALEMEGDTACVDRDELVARVRLRTQRLRIVRSEPGVLVARVRVTNAGGSILVELRVTRPGGRPSVRSLRAPSCSDALEAGALVIAITFDPDATLESPITEPSDGVSGAAEPKAGASAESQKPPSEIPRQPASDVSVHARVQPDARKPIPWRSEWAVGIFGNQLYGVAPRAMPGIGAFGTVALRHGNFFPAVRVKVAQHFSVSLLETDGTASFSAQSAGLDVCPLGAVLGRASLRGCAYLSLTLLHADGTDTFSPRSNTRAEFALGSEIWAGFALTSALGIVASGGLAGNLRRDRFAFSPTVFYRMPRWMGEGSLGLELRFP